MEVYLIELCLSNRLILNLRQKSKSKVREFIIYNRRSNWTQMFRLFKPLNNFCVFWFFYLFHPITVCRIDQMFLNPLPMLLKFQRFKLSLVHLSKVLLSFPLSQVQFIENLYQKILLINKEMYWDSANFSLLNYNNHLHSIHSFYLKVDLNLYILLRSINLT